MIEEHLTGIHKDSDGYFFLDQNGGTQRGLPEKKWINQEELKTLRKDTGFCNAAEYASNKTLHRREVGKVLGMKLLLKPKK